jgi:hypothetical protein
LSVKVERVTSLAMTKTSRAGLGKRPTRQFSASRYSDSSGQSNGNGFVAPMGLEAINALLVALRSEDKKLDVNDRQIRKSLENLAEAIQERLGVLA